MNGDKMNTQELHVVYQSNEPVPVSGDYQVVRSKTPARAVQETGPLEPQEPTVTHLTAGELFPNEEGRAVTWRLVKGE